MTALSRATIASLLVGHKPPCLSLYQPTHRGYPQSQQDAILFRNLLKTAEESLHQKYPGHDLAPVVKRLHALATDDQFWHNALDGLAVLASSDTYLALPLPRTVKPLAMVGDGFHVQPLLRYTQSADRFQVLALTRRTAKMYEGDRYDLERISTEHFPATIEEALGEEWSQDDQAVMQSGGGSMAFHHGRGTPHDEVEKDEWRFFKVIDGAVADRFSKPSGLPLVLVALAEHQAIFRRVSQNMALTAQGVETNPEALDLNELREVVWKAVEPYYLTRLAQWCEDYTNAQALEMGSSDLCDVVKAALSGRVGRLMIEADRVVPGRVDPRSGAILQQTDLDSGGKSGKSSLPPFAQADAIDLLEEVAEKVLRTGGEVVVVPPERMPSSTGLAATYRF
ncbi:MAG: hypothetical protein EBV06_03940 [Planctomycetia bacterium]|nr:hypothetical protein [Planctomycetia bacterium]